MTSPLAQLLEKATPGPWWPEKQRLGGAVISGPCGEDDYIELAEFFPPKIPASATTNAALAALAPDLTRLVLEAEKVMTSGVAGFKGGVVLRQPRIDWLASLAPDLARLVLEAEALIVEVHEDAAREWTASLAALNERLER